MLGGAQDLPQGLAMGDVLGADCTSTERSNGVTEQQK